MKFKSDLDKSLLLLELGKSHLIDESAELSASDIDRFKNSRKISLGGLRDLDRSISKVPDLSESYKSWNDSTKDKKFQKQVSLLAANFILENFDYLIESKYEMLKGLSSLKTHLYIEGEYFRPSIVEDYKFDVLLETVIPIINKLELSLLNEDISLDLHSEINTLLRLISESEVVAALSALVDKPVDSLGHNLTEDSSLLNYYHLLNMKPQIDYLESLLKES